MTIELKNIGMLKEANIKIDFIVNLEFIYSKLAKPIQTLKELSFEK